MRTFSYKATDAHGSETAGTIEAGGLASAIERIRMQGLFPDSVREKDAQAGFLRALLDTLFSFWPRRKERQTHLIRFTRQLADLLAGGVPLPLSLSILHDRQRPGKLKDTFRKLADNVEEGIRLSEALAAYPETFGDLYETMVQAGEESGKPESALQSLARMLEENNALARKSPKITGKSLVQLFVVCWLLGYLNRIIGTFISQFYYIPYFQPESFSQGVIYAAAYTLAGTQWLWFLALCSAIVIFLGTRLLNFFGLARLLRDKLALRLPLSGRVVQDMSIAQFMNTVGTLMAWGMSFERSLIVAREAIDNRAVVEKLEQISNQIERGGTVACALKGANILTPTARDMIVAGEQTDSLDSVISQISAIYASKASNPLRRLFKRLFFATLFLTFVLFMITFLLVSIREGFSLI